MNIDMKIEDSLRLSDLTQEQLQFEKGLLNTIISLFPYLEPPTIIMKQTEIAKLFILQKNNDEIFSQTHMVFLRFSKVGFIKKYNPIDYYSKNIIKFEVDEEKLRNYFSKVTTEIKKRNDVNHIGTLTINEKSAIFTFQSSENITKTAKFKNASNEYKILMKLIDNRELPFEVGKLTDLLNDPRRDAENADNKRRVLDVIKAIRKKLGQSIILTTSEGLVMKCKVIKE